MVSILKSAILKIHVILGLLTIVALFITGSANALTITEIGPFSGSLTESWESFTTGVQLADGSTIFGGNASISHPNMVIYDPGVFNFGIGSSGTAQVVDGFKGLGLRTDDVAQIDFNTPVSQFGGYWGAATDSTGVIPTTISLTFLDVSLNVIGTDSFTYLRLGNPGDGELEWHGWSSTEPFSAVQYSGEFVVNDSLQAEPGNVIPEPATMMLFGFGLLGLAGLKRRLGNSEGDQSVRQMRT